LEIITIYQVNYYFRKSSTFLCLYPVNLQTLITGMRKYSFYILFFIGGNINAQSQTNHIDRLKVFIDCLRGCDMTYIKSEINIVDFLLDRQAADVHILINDQNTGSGGDEYQVIFFGQNQFRNLKDTLIFINNANNTEFEERALLVKYLKLGLAPFIAKTKMAAEIQIQMKTNNSDTASKINTGANALDPWKYWVYRTSLGGNYNIDAVYKESSFYNNISASKITDDIKIVFELNGSKSKSEYSYADDNGVSQRFTNKNNSYNLAHHLIKSINQHWSWGYEISASRNTFSNIKSRYQLVSGIEYNIFPYKSVNTKKFTISYLLETRRNQYIDTTLYDKTKETLYGHGLEAKLSINQKWGQIYIGSQYHNYLHDWKYYNLEFNSELDIRITGGLSFNIYTSAQLTRDQLELPKEGATPQEVLTRRRQLASGYNFRIHFGFSYRFGSKLNNFVNPRFD